MTDAHTHPVCCFVASAAVLVLCLLSLGEARAEDGRVEELLAAFDRYFVAPASPEDPSPGCATMVLGELRARWTELAPSDQHRIDWITNPFYRHWVQGSGMTWLEGDVDAFRQAARETCFVPMDIDWGLGGTDQETDSEHFRLYWSLDGMTSPLAIDQILADLEDALSSQVDTQGFVQPNQLDTYQMVVATQWMEGNTIAYTAVEGCGSLDYMDYIVVNQRYLSAPEQIRSTMAHELFHTIQRRYGYQEYVLGAGSTPNRWWMETSAVYSERMTVSEAPEPVVEQATRWPQATWKSMVTYDEAGHQYGMVVWALALETSLGTTDWHRGFWEHIQDKTDYLLRDEFEAYLSAHHSSSFLDEYRSFLAAAATAEFAYDADFVGLRELGVALSAANGTLYEHSPGEFPLSQEVSADHNPPAPEYLGANYIWIEPGDHSGEEALLLTVQGPAEVNGEAVEWVFEAIAVAGGVVADRHSFDLAAADEGASWRGEVLLSGFLTVYDGVYLVASPVSDFGEDHAGWSYGARLREGGGTSGFGAVPDEAGCACGVYGRAPQDPFRAPFVLGVAGVAFVLLRRRREGRA